MTEGTRLPCACRWVRILSALLLPVLAPACGGGGGGAGGGSGADQAAGGAGVPEASAPAGAVRLGDSDLWLLDASVRLMSGMGMGAAYFTIENRGDAADRLVAVRSPAGHASLHETLVEEGMSKMRERPEGFTVPPGGTLRLLPGGRHVMLAFPPQGRRGGGDATGTPADEDAMTHAGHAGARGDAGDGSDGRDASDRRGGSDGSGGGDGSGGSDGSTDDIAPVLELVLQFERAGEHTVTVPLPATPR